MYALLTIAMVDDSKKYISSRYYRHCGAYGEQATQTKTWRLRKQVGVFRERHGSVGLEGLGDMGI